MAYAVTCADTGADCPGHFATETKEELMDHLKIHIDASHPGLDLPAEQAEALVKVI